jgi:hypothetical protein
MANQLSTSDLNQLNSYVTSGDRAGYWSFLADKGDGYAALALGVANNDTVPGEVANQYMEGIAGANSVSCANRLSFAIGDAMLRAAAFVTELMVCRFPFRAASLVTLVWVVLTASSIPVAYGAESFNRIDLSLPEADGYGVYAWSPDSKFLAMSENLGGGLIILDLSTGKVRSAKLPPFLPRAVAWSADQGAVVILSNNGFLVVRTSDLAMIANGSWKPPGGPPSFFGWSVAFSPDGPKLLFDNGDVRKAGPLLRFIRLFWRHPLGMHGFPSCILTIDSRILQGSSTTFRCCSGPRTRSCHRVRTTG